MKPYSEQEHFQDYLPEPRPDPELDYFFSHAYHDMRFFLKTITRHDASEYTYFGDVQRDLFYISDNMRDTFGFSSNLVPDLLGRWRERIYGERWRAMYDRDRISMIREKRELHDLRYQVEDKDGKVFWIRCCGAMQWDKDHTKPLFFAGRLSRQDEHFTVDPITNFPTDDTFQRHLMERERCDRKGVAIGISLNNLSQVNMMHGRSMADQLIGAVSRQLMDQLGDAMTFYRLPGIRCVALADELPEDRDGLLDKIRSIVAQEYRNEGCVVDNPCSFAMMDFPQAGLSPKDFQETLVSLLKIARREQNGGCVEYSEQNIRRVHELSALEMTIMEDVLHGMINFQAVIQPVVSAETGKIIAGETLLRWRYKDREISPAVFIPVLEKNRMIQVAGRWVLEQAVSACARIVERLPDFYLTVNISLQQLSDQELLDFLPQVLKRYGLEGHHLVIEMTESCMDKDPTRLHQLMDVCSSLGVRLALDDFGTGYSSLRVLLQYPTNIIKLDRSLLLEMTESVDKFNFINSIVFACHQFGKKVCIEGVETDQQRQLARDARCDMIQDFYYHRPTEIPEVLALVEQQTS